MEDVIKIVRTYRLTDSLAERLRLADQIIRIIGPELNLFIFSRLPSSASEDVSQIVLFAVANGLDEFEGNTQESFWGWCHRIARNKIADFYKKENRSPFEPLPPEEFLIAADKSGAEISVAAGVHDDLKYAMNLLKESKPECFDYLWGHYILDISLAELAEQSGVAYDACRMRLSRCLEFVQNLVS